MEKGELGADFSNEMILSDEAHSHLDGLPNKRIVAIEALNAND